MLCEVYNWQFCVGRYEIWQLVVSYGLRGRVFGGGRHRGLGRVRRHQQRSWQRGHRLQQAHCGEKVVGSPQDEDVAFGLNPLQTKAQEAFTGLGGANGKAALCGSGVSLSASTARIRRSMSSRSGGHAAPHLRVADGRVGRNVAYGPREGRLKIIDKMWQRVPRAIRGPLLVGDVGELNRGARFWKSLTRGGQPGRGGLLRRGAATPGESFLAEAAKLGNRGDICVGVLCWRC